MQVIETADDLVNSENGTARYSKLSAILPVGLIYCLRHTSKVLLGPTRESRGVDPLRLFTHTRVRRRPFFSIQICLSRWDSRIVIEINFKYYFILFHISLRVLSDHSVKVLNASPKNHGKLVVKSKQRLNVTANASII